MKILIVSGFLGAGKTTFMQHLIDHIEGKVAIMENEYGALSVDANRLANRGEIFDFSEGCICCSMKSDFTMTVLTIANSVAVDYLLIEPTGVGLLGNILESLSKIQYERIQILAPITVIDGKNFFSEFEKYPDLLRNQIKYAERLILSKIEDLDFSQRQEIISRLEVLNPRAKIVSEHYSQKDKAWWQELLDESYELSGTIEPVAPPSLSTVAFENLHFANEEAFQGVCRMLLRGSLGRIQRAKGEVRIGSQSYQFDLVENEMKIERNEENEATGMVLIGENLNLKDLNLLFSYYQK